MWFACGSEERGLDGIKVVASQAAKCGVPVSWNMYAGMPHEFPLLLSRTPQGQHCLDAWAEACSKLVGGQIVNSRATLLEMPACEEVDIGDVADLAPLPLEEVKKRMKMQNRERRVYTGVPIAKAQL